MTDTNKCNLMENQYLLRCHGGIRACNHDHKNRPNQLFSITNRTEEM